MDKNDAKKLVIKLTNAAYEAGMHYNSTMKESWQEKAVKIGDEIVRHLTAQSGVQNKPNPYTYVTAAYKCPECGGNHFKCPDEWTGRLI